MRKPRALATADIFASASQYEGFELVFLEAMAFGLPVVCYDHCGQTDYFSFVVPLNDIETFARSLRTLHEAHEAHEAHERTRAIGAGNCERVEEYFIDRCAECYERVFERVLTDRRRT